MCLFIDRLKKIRYFNKNFEHNLGMRNRMQDYKKMDKYCQSNLYNHVPNRPRLLRFSSLFVIASGLLLAIILMAIMNSNNETMVQSTTENVGLSVSATQNNSSIDPIPNQAQTIHQPVAPQWQNIPIAEGDTLISLLSDLNVNSQDTFDLLNIPEVKKTLAHLSVGQNLQVKINDDNHLTALRYPVSDSTILTVSNENNNYVAKLDHLKTNVKDVYTSATINNSLYTAASQAGLSTKTTMQLINIFSSKVNFSKDIHQGDSFQLIYQDKYNKKQDLGPGDILAARLYVGDKAYTAIAYQDKNGETNYYTPTGGSLKSGFLRKPVHYTRVSSPFNMHRFHPILHIRRPHEGVDLASPRGTPVKAAANGKIVFMGKDGGYGNLIKIDHGHYVATRYAHLSRFAKGLHVGSYVHEGQRIAYVGSTGLATGPHLHFEVRIHNIPKNPFTVALPNFGKPLPTKDKTNFLAQADKLMVELNQKQPTTMLANNITTSPSSSNNDSQA